MKIDDSRIVDDLEFIHITADMRGVVFKYRIDLDYPLIISYNILHNVSDRAEFASLSTVASKNNSSEHYSEQYDQSKPIRVYKGNNK